MFILGSLSPQRSALLAQMGIHPDKIIGSKIDETPLKKEVPQNYVQRMALEKFDALKNQFPDDWLLTADTIVTRNRKIIGKPKNIDEAKKFLLDISGCRHRVITSFVIGNPEGKQSHKSVTTIVKVKNLSESEVNFYLSSNEWQNRAGGYAIQGMGSVFIANINGCYTNVVGLPLSELFKSLNGLGYHFK